MKYRRKPRIIEAEQFLLEIPHPLLGSIREINIPQDVLKHKGCGYRMCNICGGANPEDTIYYIETHEGTRYLHHEDYLVTDVNGKKYVVTKAGFEESYEKVD